MDQRLSIITLGVSDLQRTEDLYCSKLGWKKLDSSNDRIIFIQMNGLLLSLYSKEALAEDADLSPTGSGFAGFTLAYNTRTKEEVDTLFADFKSKGITIMKSPKKAFWGGYSGYMADPDGYLWEVAYNPYMKLDEEGNVV